MTERRIRGCVCVVQTSPWTSPVPVKIQVYRHIYVHTPTHTHTYISVRPFVFGRLDIFIDIEASSVSSSNFSIH